MDERFDTGLAPRDIDPARPRPLETPWGTFALFRHGEIVRCVQAFCPHLEGPLFQGTVSAHGTEVTCPWHLWRFSLDTGARCDLPALLGGRRGALLVCSVSVSERGTLLLSAPRSGAVRG